MSSTSEPALLIGHSTAESSGSSVVMMDTPQTPDLFEGVSPTNNPESDPPVIIGMSCRLPGNIGSPSDLWDFIVSQKSAQGPVPAQRYNIDAFYHPNGGNRSGLTNVPGGYFLNGDIRSFDNTFFGISNLEATYMDPQQRSLLEVAYECVEDAGVSMQNLSGSTTGVFVGNFSVDYQPMMLRDPDYLHRYIASGSGATIMSNRISHIFNLHGPSFTVDTACSSSLYALHQAVNAIKTGDCDSAIVASANMVMTPEAHIAAAKSGVLSPTGTCHTFDISADGYGRAEAVNAIYVKRLSAALRDGNPIRAVIRGSAVNASGRTAGISLPSGDQQEVVMRKAYQNAGLDVTGTDYVECHGTGTPVGDPIEVDAVGRTFSRREGKPLLIGSVKTNIGHSEGASGLTSILKVVKSFEHGLIPPSYGIVKLNPKLKLEERNLKIALKVEEWPRSLRRASINSFGYGGANAHLILESAESYLSQQLLPNPQESLDDAEDSQQLMVLPVSAATPATCDTRLKQISQTVTKWKRNERTNLLRRLAHTLTTGRDHLRHRKFLLVRQETDGSIQLVESSNEAAFAPKINRLPFGFVFTGQGAQYAGMAKELLVQSQHFRNTIRKLDVVLKSLPAATAPSWTLEQTILDAQGASRINEVTRSQPICTAVQIGLVDLLRSWGVQPTSVVGHSSGEIGAAYAAGLLTYSQAILVAYYRGFAVGKLTSKGTMMAAGLSDKVAKTLIADNGLGTQVRVACVNSPESVTLSGSADGIETLKLELQSQSKFARALETGGRAYHSHMMEEIGELYESLLRPLFEESGYQACPSAASSRVTMYSSVGHSHTGMEVGVTDFAAYWRRNLEQPVQFSAALTNLLEAMEGNIHLIEVGPHAALKGPIQQIRTAAGFTKDSTPYSPTLVRNQDADISVKLLCGTLYTYGHDLTWTSINGLAKSGLRTLYDLPTYPWDYSNGLLWSEPRISIEMRNRIHARHELLGTPALTGSGIDFTWRNVLKPNEMPWIKDHRLEDQVLFPAAGYLAMAIEAVSQATASKGKPDISFQLRDVNITAALNVPLSGNNTVKDLELHTTMTRRKASTGQASSQWYDFSISSWVDGQTALHCTGSIRVSQARTKVVGYDTTAENSGDLEEGPAGRWYTKWHQEGMCFGPNFQSLTKLRTDRARVRRHLRGTVALHPAGIDRDDTYYPVHPITIDACLQAAAWSTVAGNLPDLKAWLPVFISECTIQPAQTASESEDTEINAYSKEAGPSSIVTKGVLRDARGTPIVEIQGTRMSLYSGNSQASTGEFDKYMERQPTLRVLWKPDVLRLSRECEVPLVQYVAEFIEKQPADIRDDQSMAAIGALLDLAGHKNPRMRFLELGGDCVGYKAQHWKGVLDGETAFSRCKSWSTGEIDENGTPVIPDGSEEPYDVLVIPKHATSEQIWAQTPPEQIAALVSDHGIAIFRKSAAARDVWESASFEVLDVGKEVLLAIRPVQKQVLHDRRVIIVQPESPSPIVKDFGNTLATYLQKKAGVSSVIISTLGSVDLFDKQTIVISLLELEREFLATMSPQDMDGLRAATDVVADLLWLTGANMLGSQPDPNLTLSSGLSRALMLEQPALRFSVMDVGSLRQEKMLDTSANVIKALVARYDRDDCEYIEKNSMLCISRYTPDFGVNSLFRRRVEQQSASQKQTLASAGRAQLSIRRPGGTDTLHFQQQTSQRSETLPPPAYVDIQVRALSLSASDVSAMIAGTNSATAIDFSGVVTAVGPDVEHLKQGDRVVACVPHQFGTIVRVPARSVHPMLDHESFTVVPTMLSAYSAALHAINDKVHIRARESVLVHPGPGAIGIAAIVLALSTGAIVYTTAETEGERQLHQDLGVPQSHIFSLQEASFTVGIMEATGGRGVNAVLNVSLVGDAMQESWRCLTAFGRFVELGERELQGAGKLDMSVFLRNASFSAVKLTQLFYATDEFHRDRFDELVASTLELYRAGKIQPPPTKEFDVSQLSEAYRHFSGKEWMGNIVICMENPRSRVLVAPAKYATTFDPEKVYLLVGCLGGLGRSLSRWMMSRGARHFVFLGRSGTDKPSAQTLVSNLEKVGATVGVVRGDVSVAADVNASVLACLATGRQIGGVIQAAMGLHEALFTRMPHKGWHTGIQPKWAGTWNLHNALEGHDIDFFLLTSSVSGTVGTATESNYCSANGFLDAFARWRRSQGKPAVSVGLGMISEVGYLHENPEIEALLLRKGIQPLTEEDMIQLVDLALASKPLELEEAHLLTGLEPAGIRALTAQGFDVTNHGVLVEARASVLLASLFAAEGKSGGKDQQAEAVAAAAPWFKELPSALTTALAAEADAETMHLAIIRLVKKRFSNLILMPFDQIDETRSLPDFGVDSMIASEFRTWFWSTFKIDVPFLDLMSAQKSLKGLAAFVEEKINTSKP